MRYELFGPLGSALVTATITASLIQNKFESKHAGLLAASLLILFFHDRAIKKEKES